MKLTRSLIARLLRSRRTAICSAVTPVDGASLTVAIPAVGEPARRFVLDERERRPFFGAGTTGAGAGAALAPGWVVPAVISTFNHLSQRYRISKRNHPKYEGSRAEDLQ